MKDRDLREFQREISRLNEGVGRGAQTSEETLDAVAKLSTGLEELLQRQRRRQRHVSLNSFVAYLLFTILLGACFFLLYRSRVGSLLVERDRAVEARDTARTRARELQDTVAARRDAEQAAAGFHELLQSEQHAAAVAAYGDLDKSALSSTESAVFEEGVRKSRSALVDAGLSNGVDAIRSGDFEKASAELRRVMPLVVEDRRAAQLRYYLGLSLLRQGSPAEASRLFTQAIEGKVETAGQVDARFQLAVSLVQSGRLEEAVSAFNEFVASYPRHKLSPVARRRSAQIKRTLGKPKTPGAARAPATSAKVVATPASAGLGPR